MAAAGRHGHHLHRGDGAPAPHLPCHLPEPRKPPPAPGRGAACLRCERRRSHGSCAGGPAFRRGGGFPDLHPRPGGAPGEAVPRQVRAVCVHLHRHDLRKAAPYPDGIGKNAPVQPLFALRAEQNSLRGHLPCGVPAAGLSPDHRAPQLHLWRPGDPLRAAAEQVLHPAAPPAGG